MVQRVKGSRRGSRGQASGVRAILLAHRRKRFGPGSRWHIPGKLDEIADALEDSRPVIVSSSLLWSALSTAGLPNDDYGRDAPLNGKYWLIDEFDVFDDWTDPHPAEDPARTGHCNGGRTCTRCDPENTGLQTVDVAPVREIFDWCFVEWEAQ